ncbi:MAG: 5'/3'-nucleotidase SurE [Clostridia bacterium]|nr:5'/3'-nucleotidase SurE [Clostridia bacterium]
MNILISNDDGIESPALKPLVSRLVKNHNVLIVVPDGNRSGLSHSLSFYKNLTILKRNDICGAQTYTVSGTPADCVKFASHVLTDFKTDLVLAGINLGHNLGTDVLYSGTVSAAIEGATLGYKSMAFSSVSHEGGDLDYCAEITVTLIDVLYKDLTNNFIWNVNIPDLPKEQIKGYKVTPLGKQLYSDNYKKVSENEYVLIGKPQKNHENPEDCDVEWSSKGYVTLTPILYNKTDFTKIYEYKDKIEKTYKSL